MPKKGYKRTKENIQNISIGTKIGLIRSDKYKLALQQKRVGKRGKDKNKELSYQIRCNNHLPLFHTQETKQKMSISKKKLFEKFPELRKIYGEARKIFWSIHPEKHPNRIMSKDGFISKPQQKLFAKIILLINEPIEIEYPIKCDHSTRYLDIAIPSIKLNIEYDGEYWHQDKQRDKIRDLEVSGQGWIILRYNKNNINNMEEDLHNLCLV